MQELILQPDESIILNPGEGIAAGTGPLRLRVGQSGMNDFEKLEQSLWQSSKQRTGNQIAVYRRGDESRLICVVPENAKPEYFGIEGHNLAVTTRAFKIQKSDMLDWLPQSGDTLEWNEKTYTVRKFGANVFYQDVGNYNVVLRIFVTEYRSQETGVRS